MPASTRPARRPRVLPAALALLPTLAGCARTTGPSAAAPPGPTAQCDLNTPAPPPASAAPHASAGHALHNVHRLTAKVISGGVPEGDAAFDELKAMGVRTVVSVDGATPDVARAQARGLRYVHVPTTYAEVTEAQRLELARAVRDLPGPIYVHCHHGKHRGPAAAAAAAVALGEITPGEGVAFMKTAGTAPNYKGLYACVAAATPATPAEIDAAPGEFPSVRRARGIVAAMVEIDLAYEHLGAVRAAGWSVPADHPDLVPAAEAGRLADNLRLSHEDPAARALGRDFESRLADAIARASALEEALVADEPRPALEARWAPVAASCKECHARHRDGPG